MNNPLLSIVIANYNYGRFLEEAIQSVLSQSCDDYELIIVDGGSTDNSVEIIKKYEDKIAWWVSEKDKGQSDAFNKGFAHAKGRFLTWLNADDVMLPGVIEKLKCAAEKHPKCEWFVGGVLWLDPEMKVVNCGRGRPFSEIRYREGNVSVWGPSSFFTKRLLDAVGGVDERFHYTMDTDLWLRFACKENARYLPFCKYAWGLRLHPDAKMSGHNFTEDGKLDAEHSEKEKMAKSKHVQKIQQEIAWRNEYFKPKQSTLFSRLSSASWFQVLGAKCDLLRWKDKNYKKCITQKVNLKGAFMKIAFISMHPAPYRDAFIEKLVQNNPKNVDVFNFLSLDKGHDFWGLEASTFKVEELGGSRLSFFRMTFKLLRMFVFSKKYDFVMWPGWTYKPLFMPIFLSALFRKKFGFSADTVKQRKISKIGFILKRFVVNRAKIILVPGEAGRLFFSKTFDTDTNKILMGAYALDGDRIEIEILKRRANLKSSIRNKYDIMDNSKVFLMVANMIPTRHYPITVSAFVEVAKQNKNAVFLIVGRGPDLELMQEISLKEKCIRVIPGCSFDEMLSLYAMSDVYVHGGTEPASTALVIGAISHLPLISSMAVGCAKDVLVDGESGVLVEDYKNGALWELGFEKMLKSEDLWKIYGDRARDLSLNLDVDVCVNRFANALNLES